MSCTCLGSFSLRLSRTSKSKLRELRWSTRACIVFMFCAAMTVVSPAQTFTTLVNFAGTNGSGPQAPLIQGFDGNFYGTTNGGATNSYGTVFKVSPTGTLTTLHNFALTDGSYPAVRLVQAANGNLYGTTNVGGTAACPSNPTGGCGTVFKITPAGALTTLHSFDGTDGYYPEAALVRATDGNFYGATLQGGTSNLGTIFKITAAGTLTSLHSFDSTDGSSPSGGLVQATDGNFYGITYAGGASNDGTVFRITATGALTTLHSFDGTDGANSYSPLIQATNGELYGATAFGGANDCTLQGTVVGCGTIFSITLAGALTTLHQFVSTDGAFPSVGLVQATDGSFYGTTYQGGANSDGTVFEITPAGVLATLHAFDSTDGVLPNALIQDTNGKFYGTTLFGGSGADGTVFSLATGLHAFVEAQPTSAKVGTKVIILGTKLKGTTAVSFNGTAATFTVVSASEITTTVPAGATTGKVKVTTLGGTLSSYVAFRVTP
jgi:uncharacterized repeat protein (TIGR03803 family)